MFGKTYPLLNQCRSIFKHVLTSAVIIALLVVGRLPLVFAHGGEDHGEEKAQAPIAATSGQMNVMVGKTSNLEVLLKYPTPKFGEETPIRIFVTDLITNTPAADVKVILTFSYQGNLQQASTAASGVVNAISAPQNVATSPSETPGIYEARVTFPDMGQYNVAIRLEGKQIDAQVLMSGIVVPNKAADTVSNSAGLVSPVMFILLSLLGLTVAIIISLVWLRSRRGQQAVAKTGEHIAS